MFRKNSWSQAIIVLILVTVSFLHLNNNNWKKEERVIFWDVKSYYAYLPALIIHNDIHFNFVIQQEYYRHRIWLDQVENGNYIIKPAMGMSLLYLPFFVLGHLTAHLSGADATGYSTPYFIFMLLGSLFYLGLGLIVVRKILLQYFSDITAAVTIGIIFFGTNLFWYSVYEATMSHVYSFALFASFIYFTIKWYRNPTIVKSLAIGLIIGLIALVRPSNAIVVLFFLFYDIKSMADIRTRLLFYLHQYKPILIIIITALLIVSPQLLYWKYVTGNWILYTYGRETFYFDNPQIIKGLFGFRKGWFIYAPVMLVAVLSIPMLWRRANLKQFFLPILIFLLVNFYIVFSWWSWWYGGSFGLRALIESSALLSIPLALSITAMSRQRKLLRNIFIVVLAAFTAHGLWGNIKYYYGSIHWEAMTRDALLESYFRAKPTGTFYSLLQTPDYRKDFGFYNHISCDAETINNKKLFESHSSHFFFSGTEAVTTEQSFSGNKSIKLNSYQPFGFTVTLPGVERGEHYLITAKRLSNSGNGFLVAQAENIDQFYKTESMGTKIKDSEWEEITLQIKTPDAYPIALIIYCWNPSEEDVYFDDITIQLQGK